MAFPLLSGQPTISQAAEGGYSMQRRALSLVLLLTTVVGLTACSNTIRGVGRDMHQTGHAIEDAVKGR
jgi:predicted small secreted protein